MNFLINPRMTKTATRPNRPNGNKSFTKKNQANGNTGTEPTGFLGSTTATRSFSNHESFPETNTDLAIDYDENMLDQGSDESDCSNENIGLNSKNENGKAIQRLKELCDNKELSTFELPGKNQSQFASFKQIEEYLKAELDKAFKQLPAHNTASTFKKHNNNNNISKSKQAPHPRLSVKDSISLLNEREYNLISIDNEFFERQNTKVTEIGVCIYKPSYQKFALYPHFLNFHFIIKEFINLRNGHFVPDSKMNNITGQSIVIKKKDLPKAMDTIFKYLGPETCIVGHNVSGDINSFKYLDYKLPSNLYVIDTVDLWTSLLLSKNIKSSLSYILDTLNVPHAFLHNGANDAYYTLVVCLMLSSPEVRNNIIFHKKKSIQQEIRETAIIKPSSTYVRKNPPDLTGLTPLEADMKKAKWIIKQSKAEAKAKIPKKLPINSMDLVKIRCATDEKTIIKKHKGPEKLNARFKKNPAVNNFFTPVEYNDKNLVDKLEELNA